MTTSPVISALDTKVQEFRIEKQRHTFVDDLAHLVTALGAIEDLPPADFNTADRERLREMADEIVDAIESRIDSDQDRESVKQHLASTIYEVRRRMEVIDARFRHEP